MYRRFVVFFFKQKTADEMRISDWSSDVCSSDITAPALAMGVDPPPDDVMDQPPRRLTDRVIDAEMWIGIAWVGLVMALVTLAALDLGLAGGLIHGDGE